jgi:hypothetical protein
VALSQMALQNLQKRTPKQTCCVPDLLVFTSSPSLVRRQQERGVYWLQVPGVDRGH